MFYLIPRADDPSRKHKKVTHGNQAGPDDQGEKTQKLLKDGLNADQYKHSQEDSQRRGDCDDKGHVVLNILETEQMGKNEGKRVTDSERERDMGLHIGRRKNSLVCLRERQDIKHG